MLSALVTEQQPDGDLKIYLSGLTGGFSAYNTLGLSEVAAMDPEQEVPLVFRCWERWLQLAGICDSIKDIDFIEMHAFAGACARACVRACVQACRSIWGLNPLRTELCRPAQISEPFGRSHRLRCRVNAAPCRLLLRLVRLHPTDTPLPLSSLVAIGVGCGLPDLPDCVHQCRILRQRDAREWRSSQVHSTRSRLCVKISTIAFALLLCVCLCPYLSLSLSRARFAF